MRGFVGLGIVATGVGPFSDGDDQFADCRTSAVAGGSAAIGGPFELVDNKGRTVTEQDVIVEPSLIYFGYTFCPDVCPFDTVRNAEAIDLLAAQGLSATRSLSRLTLNATRPKHWMHMLKIYTQDGRVNGNRRTGKSRIKGLSHVLQTHNDDPEYYIVDHSTQTYLMLPEHGFVEFFNRNTSAEQIAETAACFIENS